MKALTIEQIASRLDDRFNLLTLGSRTAFPRHQTLRATIDWSYDLLSQSEQRLFNRLSVFTGGFTLEATEAVCAGDGIKKAQILDLLARLVDKSLVVMETSDDEARYLLLDTIREYAWEKLVASGESKALQSCHLEFFRKLACQAESYLRMGDQVIWLDRLEQEHDNLRSALIWSRESDDLKSSLQLTGDLALFWYLRGYWSEGSEWLDRTLQSVQASEIAQNKPRPRDFTCAWAKALYGAAWLKNESGEEIALYEQSLDLSRELGDEWGAAFSLRGLGVHAFNQGNRERARQLLDDSMALFQKLKDPWGTGLVYFSQGWLAFDLDDHRGAEACWEASNASFRKVQDLWGIAVSLGALGYLARFVSDYKKATALSKESLDLFRVLGDKAGIADSLSRLGSVALRKNDFKQATELFEESLVLQRRMGYVRDTASSLSNLGLIACYQGDYSLAAKRIEESLVIWQKLGSQEGIAWAQYCLGLVAYDQGDLGRARELWQESLDLSRAADYKIGIALALDGLGRIAYSQGDYPQAVRLLQESLELFRELKDKRYITMTLNSLGKALGASAHLDEAERLYRESLLLGRELGAKRDIAEALEGLAGAVQRQGYFERAALLFGAAHALRETIGTPLPYVERREYETSLGDLRSQLGQAAFESLWTQGTRLAAGAAPGDWEQAVAYALEEKEH